MNIYLNELKNEQDLKRAERERWKNAITEAIVDAYKRIMELPKEGEAPKTASTAPKGRKKDARPAHHTT